jgi:hypothetical protein
MTARRLTAAMNEFLYRYARHSHDVVGCAARRDPLTAREMRSRHRPHSQGPQCVHGVHVRKRGDDVLIRPVSARYMHKKEVDAYAEENPNL